MSVANRSSYYNDTLYTPVHEMLIGRRRIRFAPLVEEE